MKREIRKGRGALSNPAGRFEALHRHEVDDGWHDAEAAELPPLETTVTAEPAKSIITRNDSPDLGFSMSINPYRGCEHGCVYCVSGDTPILMADGSTKPIAELAVGDDIYGTVREGSYRRYVRSRVLNHWRVIKPAHRVTLGDGTVLVTGPDHRFLTERGWKYVTGAGSGAGCRPHLTTHNKLMGTGAFARGPVMDGDYRRGYLCGVIRGDAHLAEHRYLRAGRSHGNVYQFRLALADPEALMRSRQYLLEQQIATQQFVFANAMAGRREMQAIRTQSKPHFHKIVDLVAWPSDPSREWCCGFLAGIFDAEGSRSDCLRISNTDEAIVARIYLAMRMLGFRFVIERIERPPLKAIQVVRLLGGLREHLRFFHTTNPAIMRKRDFFGQAVKSDSKLNVVSVEPLGKAMVLYDITTETGDFIANGVVSHNCFARPSHAYLNLSPGQDFETKLFYKPNAAQLLEKELRKPGYRCEPILVGVNTDAYQPIERKHRVTRSLLEVAQRFRQPLYLITKGATLMERDLDIIGEMGRAGLAGVTISITSLKDEIKRTLEPRTSSPATRLKLVRMLAEAGVPVGVNVAPVVPFITDGEMEAILEASRDAGATSASYVMLRLPWEVKVIFQEWLEAHFPDKAAHVMSLMRQIHGGDPEHRPREEQGDVEGFNDDAPPDAVAEAALTPDRYRKNPYYNSQWHVRARGRGAFADMIEQRFRLACRRLGLNRRDYHLDTKQFRVPPATGDQMGLDF